MITVPKYQIGQEVIVVTGNQLGIVESTKVSDVTGRTLYFVRVQEWDEGTNGGRWLGESSLKDKSS